MAISLSAIVRSAGPEDAAIISGMVGELAEYERLAELNKSSAATIERALRDGSIEAIVAEAEIDGTLQAVGFAAFFTTYSTFAAKNGLYLEDLYVKTEFRNRGVGTLILGEVARIAAERDYGRMEWTTLLWNTEAIEFYEGFGARPNDAWITYRLDEAHLDALAERAASERAANP